MLPTERIDPLKAVRYQLARWAVIVLGVMSVLTIAGTTTYHSTAQAQVATAAPTIQAAATRSAASGAISGAATAPLPGTTSAASPSDVAYSGLDFLLIIDQSGSMCGQACPVLERAQNAVPTDKDGARFDVAVSAVQRLLEWRQAVAPEVPVNISVIFFGDKALVVKDWIELSAATDANTRAALIDPNRGIFAKVAYNGKNQGNTDFAAAFDLARAQMDKAPVAAPGSRHLRAILTLTDGKPCTRLRCDEQGANEQFAHVRDVVKAFPSPEYELYLIGFEGTDAKSKFWDQYGKTWMDIMATGRAHGLAQRAASAAEAIPAFDNILHDILGRLRKAGTITVLAIDPTTGEAKTPYFVYPYTQSFTLSLYKNTITPSNMLSVRTPKGETLDFGSGAPLPNVLITGQGNSLLEQYRFAEPYPGDYHFKVTPPGALTQLTASIEALPLRAELTANDGNDGFVWADNKLSVKLVKVGGEAAQDYSSDSPAFQLHLVAHFQGSTAGSLPLDFQLQHDPANHLAIYTSAAIALPTVDRYAITLTGDLPDLKDSSGALITDTPGKPHVVLDTSAAPPTYFTVSEVIPQPDAFEPSWLQTQPQTVNLTLISRASGVSIGSVPCTQLKINIGLLAAGKTPGTDALLPAPSQAGMSADAGAPGKYSAQLTAADAGDMIVGAVGTLQLPDGSSKQVFGVPLGKINVRQLKYVTLKISAPENNSTFYALVPPFNRPTMRVVITAQDVNGSPVDLQATTGGSTLPLKLTMSVNGADMGNAPALSAAGVGLYEYLKPAPAIGGYDIKVVADPTQMRVGDNTFRVGEETAQVKINVGISPLIFAEIGGLIALLILLIGGGILYARWLNGLVPPLGQLLFIAEIPAPSGHTDVEDLQSMNIGVARSSTYREVPNAKLKGYLPGIKSIEASTPDAPSKAERRKLAQDGEIILTVQFKDKPSVTYRLKPPEDGSDSQAIGDDPRTGAKILVERPYP